jgi:hypothetical protein
LSRLLTTSSAIVLALIPASSLSAGDDQKLNFRYDPEEVATADAAANLYERIISLAEAECRMISNPPIINPRSKQCARELADQLIASIDSPLLTAHANDPRPKGSAPEVQKGG